VKAVPAAWQGALLPLVVLLVWQFGGAAGWLPPYLSTPLAVARATVEQSRDGELLAALEASLYRAYAGFALGAVSGVLIGLAAGTSKPLRHFIDPLVAFFNPIPKIAFLPVFLLLLGLGHNLIIATIALSVFFPSFIASRNSLASISPLFAWTAQNMGAAPHIVFFRVLLPAAAPQAFTGLRVGLSMTFVMLFASELISAQSGFGYLIVQGQDADRYDMMFTGIIAFALFGFLSDRVLMAVRRRVLRGQTLGTLEGLQS
jgi:ABC-type nitrate/sulfonate/bicarbonate transport system permease component